METGSKKCEGDRKDTGNNPTNYIFDQKEMRQHFIACLEKGTISMFPIRKERRRQKKKFEEERKN